MHLFTAGIQNMQLSKLILLMLLTCPTKTVLVRPWTLKVTEYPIYIIYARVHEIHSVGRASLAVAQELKPLSVGYYLKHYHRQSM